MFSSLIIGKAELRPSIKVQFNIAFLSSRPPRSNPNLSPE
jgi:hypothetical protein